MKQVLLTGLLLLLTSTLVRAESPLCSGHATMSDTDASYGQLFVTCNSDSPMRVEMFDARDQRKLCVDYSRAPLVKPVEALACQFRRYDPTRRLDYVLQFTNSKSGELINEVKGQFIPKVATFNSSPHGNWWIDGGVPQKYILATGGWGWDVVVKANAVDEDVDPSENLNLIHVELYDGDTGKIIRKGDFNSGLTNSGTITFKLTHKHFIPIKTKNKLSGKDYEEGDLHLGHNNLKLRIFDAYSGNNPANSFDLNALGVDLNE